MTPPTDDRDKRTAERERRLAADVARLNAVRSEFHIAAAAARDRLRDAWATVEAQQKRAAAGWAEANHYFSAQTSALDARAAEQARCDKIAAARRAAAEAEAAGLREEAAALDARVRNARAALADLEARRERTRADLLAAQLPAELATLPGTDDFPECELQLAREKAAVEALRARLLQESADVDDRRRVLAEQFALLAEARARWQAAERQTVAEMEELARDLRAREQDLDAREQRLIRADSRRRDEAYDLWQARLRLEAWQAKLTAFEVRWHTEREQLEADLERRAAAVAGGEPPAGPEAPPAPSAEVLALREEIERLAAAVLEMELPEPPDPPEHDLPWAGEESVPAADDAVVPFGDWRAA